MKYIFISEEDGSQKYLVDFQRKNIDTIIDKRNNRLKEEEEEKKLLAERVPAPDNPEEEWYV